VTAADADGIDEVLVEMVDEFDDEGVVGGGSAEIVEGGEVLDVFAEADAAGVGADRDAEFGSEEDDGEVLVDAGKAAAIDLTDVEGAGLKELLEEDAILALLAGGDADAGDFAADAGVAEDVVGAGGLLHPPRVELLELANAENRVVDVPFLVGVHHEAAVGADFGADQSSAAEVIGGVAADFEFEMGPAVGERFVAEAGNFFVGEAEPPGGSGVGGQAALAKLGEALVETRPAFAKQGYSFVARKSVGDVVEVDEGGDAVGRHAGEELPKGFGFDAGVEVPDGVDESRSGEMDDAFFGAEPAELRVGSELTGEVGEVAGNRREGAVDGVAGEVADGVAAEVVAVTAGEGEAEAAEAVIGFEDAVGGGVIGVEVDGVGADGIAGGGKAEVDDADGGDAEIRQSGTFPGWMKGGHPAWGQNGKRRMSQGSRLRGRREDVDVQAWCAVSRRGTKDFLGTSADEHLIGSGPSKAGVGMRWSIRFFALMVLLLSARLLTAQVVETLQGKVEGRAEPNSTVTVFKGIPYAAPPVGDLRWRAPQAPGSWRGVRKAYEFSSSCVQREERVHLPWTEEFMVQNAVSEDCLYLNVWTPKLNADAKLPVIVFIHGGAFNGGSGAIDVYHGDHLAAQGAVVVTINYRVGVFGFLAHPELSAESEHHVSGNYGLLDQRAALEWVKANIRQFGGDPGRVTIWGQSAGAASVADLVASPLAAGLFSRAQADSGLGAHGFPMASLHEAEANGVKFAAEHHAASIKELRAMPAEALLPGPGPGPVRYAPIVDGWVLPDTPVALSARGTDNDVPLITGFQAGDSTMFRLKVTSLDAYHQIVRQAYGEMAAEFERLYPVTRVEDIRGALEQSGHERSRVSMYLFASARARSHRQPIYTYFFDRGIPWPQHPEFGAFHTGELPYFFLNLGVLQRPWEKDDVELAKAASSYLVNFASRGDPNGPGLAPWPAVDANVPQTMELGSRIGPMPLADKEKVDFWTRYYASPISNNGAPF
jgi:para-nitrobenzyl esterase